MKSTSTDKRKNAATFPDGPTPINITPDEGRKLRDRAAQTGKPVGKLARRNIREGLAKAEATILKQKTATAKADVPARASSTTVSKCQTQEIYWTLWRALDDSASRAFFGLPPVNYLRFPHESICSLGFSSPEELMSDLLKKGWKKTSFDNTDDRFAKIHAKPNGLTVTAFPTFAAAVEHSKAIIAKPRQHR